MKKVDWEGVSLIIGVVVFIGLIVAVFGVIAHQTKLQYGGDSNKKFFDQNWNYDKAYVKIGRETLLVDVEYWNEDETTITVVTDDGTIYCTDQKNIVLVRGGEWEE